MKILILLIFIIYTNLWGSFEGYEYGSRAIALGTAFTGLSDDCFSIFYNPAGLARMGKNHISLFVLPNQFGLRELSTSVFIMNYNTKYGNLGFSLKKFGFELYKEITGSLAFARNFDGLNIGTTININSLTIKNYGSDLTTGIDIGFLFSLFDNFFLGFNIKNINVPTIGEVKEKLPQTILTGFSYAPVKNILILFDLQKEYKNNLSFASGIEYKVFEYSALRIGTRNLPSSYSAGIGIEYSFFKLDYSIQSHQQLGYSHSFTIGISFGGEND